MTTNHDIFIKSMGLMVELKESMMAVRDLKHEGIQKMKAFAHEVDSAKEVSNFYRMKIGQAQKTVDEKKNNVIAFFKQNKHTNEESIAIFEKELEDAMSQHQA